MQGNHQDKPSKQTKMSTALMLLKLCKEVLDVFSSIPGEILCVTQFRPKGRQCAHEN